MKDGHIFIFETGYGKRDITNPPQNSNDLTFSTFLSNLDPGYSNKNNMNLGFKEKENQNSQ